MDAIQNLRDEFPALGLTLGFASPAERSLYADLLLLWLELNRARSSSETLVAAARMTWWRDAIENAKPEGVPLAMRLLYHKTIDQKRLADHLTNIIGLTLNGSEDTIFHHHFGQVLGMVFNCDGDQAGLVLARLKLSLSGQVIDQSTDLKNDLKSMPKVIQLINWLASDPSRLHYPESKPLLALHMLAKAFRL